MSNFDISIIIPAYNEEKYIGKCIESVKRQKTSLNYEIIVVNNNSTDRTKEIVEKHNVKILDEKIQSVGAARRTGTKNAKGKIIIHIDADTRLYSDHLEKVWCHFQKDKDLVCLGGPFLFYNAPPWKNIMRPFLYQLVLSFAKITSKGALGPMGNNMAFKKNVYEKTKGFNPLLVHGEDMELCRNFKKHGKIKVDMGLKVKTSIRRYDKILNKSFLLYSLNFIFLCIKGKPYKNVLPKTKG